MFDAKRLGERPEISKVSTDQEQPRDLQASTGATGANGGSQVRNVHFVGMSDMSNFSLGP